MRKTVLITRSWPGQAGQIPKRGAGLDFQAGQNPADQFKYVSIIEIRSKRKRRFRHVKAALSLTRERITTTLLALVVTILEQYRRARRRSSCTERAPDSCPTFVLSDRGSQTFELTSLKFVKKRKFYENENFSR